MLILLRGSIRSNAKWGGGYLISISTRVRNAGASVREARTVALGLEGDHLLLAPGHSCFGTLPHTGFRWMQIAKWTRSGATYRIYLRKETATLYDLNLPLGSFPVECSYRPSFKSWVISFDLEHPIRLTRDHTKALNHPV